jgi:hypothetical protein
MIERRGDARLSQETLDAFVRHARALGQELECHVPAEPRILGFVDDSHAAGAELPDDSIVLDFFANHRVDYRLRGQQETQWARFRPP